MERHYSTNIAELHKQFAKVWHIIMTHHVEVTDNSRNMASAVNQTDFAHIPCMVCLHMSIFHGLRAEHTETLTNVKKSCHFKHSPVHTTKFSD